MNGIAKERDRQLHGKPPFAWSTPSSVPKDYGAENYRRMKTIAAEGRRRREPLKAQFIPGVTKNSRYAHVQSKVGAFLKGGPGVEVVGGKLVSKSMSDEAANRNRRRMKEEEEEEVRVAAGYRVGGGGINRNNAARLSRSSMDLRSQNDFPPRALPLRRQGSFVAPAHQAVQPFYGGPRYGEGDHQGPPTSVQIIQSQPPEESVYKWKLADEDDRSQRQNGGNARDIGISASTTSLPHCHRVEYLPCDGICADEQLMSHHHNEKEMEASSGNPDSARSVSSRTSRGCNTEETRIFPERMLQQPYVCRGLTLDGRGRQASSQNLSQFHSMTDLPQQMQNGNGGGRMMASTPAPAGNEYFLDQPIASGYHERPESKMQQMPYMNPNPAGLPSQKTYMNGGGGGDVGRGESESYGGILDQMRNMSIRNNNNRTQSNTSLRSVRTNGLKQSSRAESVRGGGGGGDMPGPHTLGTVPKYLKQRQEEWKNEELARKEAEETAHIPPGYILMSEDERKENLRRFRQNYDTLITELNRVPIRIDTIRVRNHKVDLERQLARLEEAMKTFSRPKVWVRMDA